MPASSHVFMPVLRRYRALFRAGRARQDGVVLIYALIALVILMISGLALIRGADTALAVSGNLALRRDLVNQGELGVSTSIGYFQVLGAALYDPSSRLTSNPKINYSAATLPDTNGIPTALLDDVEFGKVGSPGNDIAGSTGIAVRYVIDRLCSETGAPSLSRCTAYKAAFDTSGTNWIPKAGNVFQPVYRITVRITGPRNSMAFLQTTLGA